ncbi:MAG: ATP-binding cassette domain-containing protein [Candidatus Aureabacteria bacterium]|nr:ATP-binding cassette domain-containing protein [Candidatus Auribacterota bacterium]
MKLLECVGLTYCYPGCGRPALERIDLSIEEGSFVLITGPSGAGKTTLAHALAGLVPAFFGGRIGGQILYRGRPLEELDRRTLHGEIGLVLQDPEQALLMETVERELASGPENLGLTRQTIMRRVMESASFLGLTGLLRARTDELSGGAKQRVALGASMAMGPRTMILDEPVSQLDPVAAAEVTELLARLHHDLGYTIVGIEQRIEEFLPFATRVLFMEEGRIRFDGPPRHFLRWARVSAPAFMPPAARLLCAIHPGDAPLTIQEGRSLLRYPSPPVPPPAAPPPPSADPSVTLQEVSFSYPNGTEAVRRVNLALRPGEVTALLGPNGAGKSTLLKIICGMLQPSRGQIAVLGDPPAACPNNRRAAILGYLPQDPRDVLFNDTVAGEVTYTLRALGRNDASAVATILAEWELSCMATRNPRELSAGERQRAALAAVTAGAPPVLILDEPTRACDPPHREALVARLRAYAQRPATLLVVTQDMEFAAAAADRALVLFNGELIADGPPGEILDDGLFYTTEMSRLFRGFARGVVTFDAALRLPGIRES